MTATHKNDELGYGCRAVNIQSGFKAFNPVGVADAVFATSTAANAAYMGRILKLVSTW